MSETSEDSGVFVGLQSIFLDPRRQMDRVSSKGELRLSQGRRSKMSGADVLSVLPDLRRAARAAVIRNVKAATAA